MNNFEYNPGFEEAWNLIISQRESAEIFMAEPHLLYLADQQAKMYEDATARNDKYANTLDKPVCVLLEQNMNGILLDIGKSVSFVDLGPGYPNKSLLIIDHLITKKINVTYWAVDVSPYFLRMAVGAVAQRGISATPLQYRFEDLSAVLERELSADGRRIIFLGLTFNNFELNNIVAILAEITRKNDICLVCVQPTGGMKADDIVKPYTGEKIRSFAFQPLNILGFSAVDFKFDPVFENNCIKMCFVLKKQISVRNVRFFAGQRFITSKSYRLPIEVVREEIDQHLAIVNEYVDKKTHVTLMQLGGK